MILTIREILEAKDALQRLSRNKLPIKVSYRASRTIQKIDKVLTIYNQKLAEYMREHGKAREDGALYIPLEDKEGIAAFNEFRDALLDEPEELNIFKIQIDMLPDSFEIPPNDLIAMRFLFDGEDEKVQLDGKAEIEEVQ